MADVDAWVRVAQINPIIVAGAQFSAFRMDGADTYPVLGALKLTKDREMMGGDFLSKVAMAVKSWVNKAVQEPNKEHCSLFATRNVVLGMADLASVLKSQFSPRPFSEKENLNTIIGRVEAAWREGQAINFTGPPIESLISKARCNNFL